MTFPPDSDTASQGIGKSGDLPFASSVLEISGLRVTRAEFARIMGCSRQAVTNWVRSGRIAVGADGRFDPRQAVRSLLATGDPARIRARVLTPMVAELSELRARLKGMELKCAEAEEAASFFDESANGMLRVIDAIKWRLFEDWDELKKLPADRAAFAFYAWVDQALRTGGELEQSIMDYEGADIGGESTIFDEALAALDDLSLDDLE